MIFFHMKFLCKVDPFPLLLFHLKFLLFPVLQLLILPFFAVSCLNREKTLDSFPKWIVAIDAFFHSNQCNSKELITEGPYKLFCNSIVFFFGYWIFVQYSNIFFATSFELFELPILLLFLNWSLNFGTITWKLFIFCYLPS